LQACTPQNQPSCQEHPDESEQNIKTALIITTTTSLDFFTQSIFSSLVKALLLATITLEEHSITVMLIGTLTVLKHYQMYQQRAPQTSRPNPQNNTPNTQLLCRDLCCLRSEVQVLHISLIFDVLLLICCRLMFRSKTTFCHLTTPTHTRTYQKCTKTVTNAQSKQFTV